VSILKKLIGTHSGSFHADDVFAVASLSLLYPDYEIYRSRDPEIWERCDFLVDVGGSYDHNNRKYDHHFRNGPTYEDGLPMSSIGLVWKHYGADICKSSEIADQVCRLLIRGLDANDSGITLSVKGEGTPDAQEISLSKSIAIMNHLNPASADTAFAAEVDRARLFLQAVIADSEIWVNSKEEVESALKEALKEDLSYIEVSENCMWQEHLLKSDTNDSILYTLYQRGLKWYVRAVPSGEAGYKNRRDFPEEWGGLSGEEFSQAAGIADGIFCHQSLFICATKSKESALSLIHKSSVN
jgi:uncharacterized UPF0160 family protein